MNFSPKVATPYTPQLSDQEQAQPRYVRCVTTQSALRPDAVKRMEAAPQRSRSHSKKPGYKAPSHKKRHR